MGITPPRMVNIRTGIDGKLRAQYLDIDNSKWNWWEHTINPEYIIRPTEMGINRTGCEMFVPQKDLLTIWWGLPIYMWVLLGVGLVSILGGVIVWQLRN